MSFESIAQKFVSKLTWLNVGTGRLQAEFASHLGWSFAVPLFAFYLFGPRSFDICIAVWFVYSVHKELFADGHLHRILNGTESDDELKDMWTDLLARILPLAVLLIVQVLR